MNEISFSFCFFSAFLGFITHLFAMDLPSRPFINIPFEDTANEHFNGDDPYRQHEGGLLLESALKKGDPQALFAAGMNNLFGQRGLSEEPKEALPYFIAATMSGHLLARYFLGRIYLSWGADPRQIIYGMLFVEAAAQGGLAEAQRLWGICLAEGVIRGDEVYLNKDTPKAIEFYKLAVKKNDIAAIYRLSLLYWDEAARTLCEKTRTEAIQLMYKAHKHGYPKAEGLFKAMAYTRTNGKFDNQAVLRASQHMNLAGEICALGKPGRQDSYFLSTLNEDFLQMLIKKAQSGDHEASRIVAERSIYGLGTTRNLARTIEYLKLETQQKNHGMPFLLLGLIYLHNPQLAHPALIHEEFNKAGELNDPRAYFYLGLCSMRGVGTPRDLTKAKKLFSLMDDNWVIGNFSNDELFFIKDVERIVNLSHDEQILALDELYERGLERKIADPHKALNLWTLAAHLGHAQAAYELYKSFKKNGLPKISKNKWQSNFWLDWAAQLGHQEAFTILANFKNPSPSTTTYVPKKKKRKNKPKEKIKIITAPMADISALAPHYEKTSYNFLELLKAAKNSDSYAQFQVAQIYFHGTKDVVQDKNQAKKYLISFLADQNINEADRASAENIMRQIDESWSYNKHAIQREKNILNPGHKYCHEGKKLINIYEQPIKEEIILAPVLKRSHEEIAPVSPIKICKTPNFKRNIQALRLSEIDLCDLKERITEKPGCHIQLKQVENRPVFKIKFRIDKILNGRAIYQYDRLQNRVRLLLAYSKSSQENTTQHHINYIKQVISSQW